MDDIKYYEHDSWMVRRWNRFTDGDTPKSFCQFWRTVLLWATLASIPIIGKVFLSHLAPASAPKIRTAAEIERFNLLIRGMFGPPVAFIGWLVWPLRTMIYLLWRGVTTIVAFIDEADTAKVERVLSIIALVAIVGISVIWLSITGYWLSVAWKNNWPVFLAIVVAVPATGILLFFTLRPVLAVIGQIVMTIWHIAVVSKHRICPPIAIVRKDMYRDEPCID